MRDLEDGGELISPFVGCVEAVYRVRKALVQAGYKLLTYAQVVFATFGLGTNNRVVRRLCELLTQFYALLIYGNNGDGLLFVHTIHNPNNKYYKGYLTYYELY